MSLIKCSECGKEVSDKAVSCPNCGNPINPQWQITTDSLNEEYLCCPKCGSRELHSDKKGFSGGQALAGAVLTGGIGLLAGTIGSKNVQITCLKCGKRFKAGEATVVKHVVTVSPSSTSTHSGGSIVSDDFDKLLADKIRQEGMLAAVQFFKTRTGYDLASSKRHVDQFAKDNNITPEKNNSSGCAGVIAVFIIASGILYFILSANADL